MVKILIRDIRESTTASIKTEEHGRVHGGGYLNTGRNERRIRESTTAEKKAEIWTGEFMVLEIDKRGR